MNINIVAIGDIGVDSYVNQGVKKPGGIAFNFAANVLTNEVEVSLVSVIGSDEKGDKLIKLLETTGINIEKVRIKEGQTPEQKIELLDSGERKFVGYVAGVLKDWSLSADDLDFIAKQDALFVPLSDGMETIFHQVKDLETRAIKAVDFSKDYEFADFESKDNVITKYSQFFDIIFVGGSKQNENLILDLSRQFPSKVFILTLGSDGSLGFYHGEKIIQPAQKIDQLVDTTGCGDAFQAGFLVTWLKTKDIKKSLQAGTTRAADVIGHIGSTKLTIT